MPFNGSGTFNRLYSWVQDAANGIKIRADRMDNEMNGMATGLTDCVTRDGQSPAQANLPMGGFKHTGVADGTNATDYASLGQVRSQKPNFAVATGTANALAAAFTPTVTALEDGMQLNIRALLANTSTTPTFSPDGLTAHVITKEGGVGLVPGDIHTASTEIILRYNLAATRWELLNPKAASPNYVTTSDADLTVGPEVDVVRFSGGLSANRTLTLPALASIPSGQVIRFTDSAGINAFGCHYTVSLSGGDTRDSFSPTTFAVSGGVWEAEAGSLWAIRQIA